MVKATDQVLEHLGRYPDIFTICFLYLFCYFFIFFILGSSSYVRDDSSTLFTPTKQNRKQLNMKPTQRVVIGDVHQFSKIRTSFDSS